MIWAIDLDLDLDLELDLDLDLGSRGQNVVIFEFFSVISAQILMKFSRNFADILEDVEIFDFFEFSIFY